MPGKAGLLRAWLRWLTNQGTSVQRPVFPHERWHIAIACFRIASAFHFLCTVIDARRRFNVHLARSPRIAGREVELTIQRAKEQFVIARPRIISDGGSSSLKISNNIIRVSELVNVGLRRYSSESNDYLDR